jgi:outer membrane protein assembly factor BamB
MNHCRAVCRRLMIAVALLIVASGVACGEPAKPLAGGDSWPMFGGTPSRNMVCPAAKNVPTDWSVEEKAPKNVKWVAQLGSTAYGGPVIAGGKVFVGTNNGKPRDPKIDADMGVIMCFDEATGKFLWQALHAKLPDPNENDYPEQGIASTPAVEGDRLYYVSNRCEVVCASTAGKPDGTADILWQFDMIKNLGVYPCQLAACSPLVVGDLVFVVTGNGIDQNKRAVVNPKAASFVAVEKQTGKLRWKSDLPGDKVIDGQWSNPVYAEVNGKGQVIFPGGDGWLYSFEPNKGDLIWKFDCNPKAAMDKPGGGKGATKNNIIATPVVADGKLYVGVGRNPEDGVGVGHLWCIDLTKTGDVSPVGDNFDPKADANKNSALVWHYGGENPVKGSKRKFLFSRTLSTCAVSEGLVYVADYDGFLYCFDAKTGEKKWDFDLKATVWSAPLVIDGKVYIGAENGDFYIFPAGKTAPAKPINKIDVQGSVKSPPVFVNGVLFLQTNSQLFAIQAK